MRGRASQTSCSGTPESRRRVPSSRPGRRIRHGYLLAEALCALALAGVLAVAAATTLSAARRAMKSASERAAAERAGRESVSVIASVLRESSAVTIEGDTAVAFAQVIALGAICERSGLAIVLPPLEVSVATPLVARGQPVEPGDMISVLVVDSLAVGASWVSTLVDTVSERTVAGSCGAADGWTQPSDEGAMRWRLVLRSALPPSTQRGAPLRVLRRGRLSLYASGSGAWMLGWRRCAFLVPDAVGCGGIQPVAGPLRTPAGGGLRLEADALGRTIRIEARASGIADARTTEMTVLLRDGA